jgi:hypothetical protein
MSIAMEEAVRIYPFKGHSAEAYERCMVSRVDYVKGRTAPVTEEEIEAATRAFSDHETCTSSGFGWVVECKCGYGICGDSAIGNLVEWRRHVAKSILTAGRKQVSE